MHEELDDHSFIMFKDDEKEDAEKEKKQTRIRVSDKKTYNIYQRAEKIIKNILENRDLALIVTV